MRDLYFKEEGLKFNPYISPGFNFFACIYNLIRVASEIMDNYAECGHVAFMMACLLQGVFFVIQTIFILRNHKVRVPAFF